LTLRLGTVDWDTLIALKIHGEVVVDVCDEPADRRRYWGARGHVAFRSNAVRCVTMSTSSWRST
jgi:fructose-1,6-bisphosphatase/inositol monophosphatase family enzyme